MTTARHTTGVFAARMFVVTVFMLLITSVAASGQTINGWTTAGTKILTSNGGPFVINGINWYGFETTTYVAHGLWVRNYTAILNDVKGYGFNTIRLPFSSEVWETDPLPASGDVAACGACTGQHAREGWTFYPEPLPQLGGVTTPG